MSLNLLKIESLSLILNNYFFLEDISFTLKKGEIWGIIGESGGGKSLLLKAILNLLPPQFQIQYKKLKIKENFFYLPQEPLNYLNPFKEAEKIIIDFLLQNEKKINLKEAQEKTMAILKEWNYLKETETKLKLLPPHQISGGMRQKIFLSLAFLKNYSLILADEPTSMLDLETKKIFIKKIKEKQKQGLGTLIISHDLDLLFSLSTHFIFLYQNKIVEIGEKKDILSSPKHFFTNEILKLYFKKPRSKHGNS